jgi:hypothetical protein
LSRVPSSKRKPSEVEFITNAEKIHELVIKSIYHDFGVKTDSQNKLWLINNNKAVLKTYADRLINCVYSANSIYPACKEEVIERKLMWDRAIGCCQTIETQYKLMKRELDIHIGLAEELLRLLEHEKNLLRGIKRSDTNRYKHIQ